MKKYFLSIVALASMLFATSCQESLVEPQMGEVTTFTVQVPNQMGTKADIGDKGNVNRLYFTVYSADRSVEVYKPENGYVGITDGVAQISINLVKDQRYDIIFWAQKDDAYNTSDLTNIPMNTSHPNSEIGAAFFHYEDDFVPQATAEIVLRRPFAQLNLRTTKASLTNHAGTFELDESKITVSNVATAFNTVSGYGENPDLIEFDWADVPVEDLTVDGVEYKYVSMNYLPVAGDDKALATVSVQIKLKNDQVISHSWENIPLQENYKTNILGNLVSANSVINVTINDDWSDYEYNVKDLVNITTGVSFDPNQNIFFLDGKEGLKWYSEQSNGVANSVVISDYVNQSTDKNGKLTLFSGQTVVLTSDVDLQGVEWTPIGTDNTIAGTFDGGNHIISNLKVSGNNKRIGLFASSGHGMIIKNVKMTNVNLTGSDYVGAIVGYGLCARIENCHVDGGTITSNVYNNDGGAKAGGLVGYLTAQNNAHLKNSSVKNVTVKAFRDVAGAVGMAQNSGCIIDNVTVENVTVIANRLVDSYVDNPFPETNIGEVAGRRSSNPQITNTNVSNVELVVLEENIDGKIEVATASALSVISELMEEKNGFEGKTIVLTDDVDLFQGYMSDGDPVSTEPIGSTGEYDDRGRLVCKPFKGTFDGQGHVIKNIYQNGYLWKYWYGQYGSIGLFSELESATVKNLIIENFEARVEGGDIAFITGSATGDCVFENIEIRNSRIATFNNGIGGIIGWSGAGNYTFKNIKLDDKTTIGGFQQSFDSSVGGIVGQAEPGATYNFENIEINCRLDVYNDVTASWQYYLYRMCGMIIGRCEETTTINGVNYPDLSKYNLSFNNVVVNYGDWMNYHYYVGHGGPKGNGARVEAGFLYDGHSCASDGEAICIPFDQLIGGDQLGVRGLREVNGVTVNYPASYRREVSTAAALTEALGKGVSVILDSDIDFGSNQLAITGENQVVDLGGHSLTTANNWGGISLKNGATIKNGTITHAGNTAAIKAFNGSIVENVTINATCATADKTVTGIAVQQGANVESIKNVTINGVSQGIEVGYQATVGLIENAVVNESNNGTAKGIGLVINGGKVGKAKNCTFKGETYGVTMHLKGVFAVGLELEKCAVEGNTASIYAWDEKGVSNTSGSLTLTYDAETTLTGPFVWDFEDECKSVVTLNRPQ